MEVTKRSRRNHSAEFKAKVALAAVKGDKALSEFASHFDVLGICRALGVEMSELYRGVQIPET